METWWQKILCKKNSLSACLNVVSDVNENFMCRVILGCGRWWKDQSVFPPHDNALIGCHSKFIFDLVRYYSMSSDSLLKYLITEKVWKLIIHYSLFFAIFFLPHPDQESVWIFMGLVLIRCRYDWSFGRHTILWLLKKSNFTSLFLIWRTFLNFWPEKKNGWNFWFSTPTIAMIHDVSNSKNNV